MKPAILLLCADDWIKSVLLSPARVFSFFRQMFTSDAFALDGIAGCDMSSLKRDFYKLNKDQKGAVLNAISAEDFTLIQGLPGTGMFWFVILKLLLSHVHFSTYLHAFHSWSHHR